MSCWDRKKIEQFLQQLPEQSGVYEFKDALGEILYVGKSRNLKKRVSSYFQRVPETPRIRKMVSLIGSIDYIITANEVEALILECNLIKKMAPAYNVLFRDDKSYPYIRFNVQAKYPFVEKSRQQIQGDGALYFGPFADEYRVNELLRLIEKHFYLVKCHRYKFAHGRSCIEYQIGRCPGPCEREIDLSSYAQEVEAVKNVLSGNYQPLLRDLRQKMQEYADNLEYEKAAAARNQIAALSILDTEQDAISTGFAAEDYVAVACVDNFYLLQYILVRKGRIVHQKKIFGQAAEVGEEEVLLSWLKQHYSTIIDWPSEVVLAAKYDSADLQELFAELNLLSGRKLHRHYPQKGRKKRLLDMAARNAADSLRIELFRQENSGALLLEIQKALQLSVLPYRVECFDISNLQGHHSVAAMSVAENGLVQKADFRRFRLRTVSTPDDFAAMREVLYRRYRRLLNEGGRQPDLIVVDGGLGQLSTALEVLEELGLENIELASLAKKEELIYSHRFPSGVQLGKHSNVRLFFQRLRDEVHDFAIRYHRKLRDKAAVHSVLDEIAGIGPKRKSLILKKYPDLKKILQCTPLELSQALGFNLTLCERILATLK